MTGAREARPLGSFERAQVLTGEHAPYNLVVVVRLAGTLSPDRLRRSLDELQRRTPLLRASVEGSGRRRSFRLREAAALPLCLEEAAPDDWLRRVEDELTEGFDRRGPLARCRYLRHRGAAGDETGDLVLTFHHATADGVGVARLLRDLLTLCAGSRLPGAAEPEALPPSADERFPPGCRRPGGGTAGWRFLLRQGADELSFRWRRRRRPAPPPAGARCRVLTTALASEQTEALVTACRDRRATLTGALEAAMLLAVSRHRYGGERLPLRYFVFPVLRPYLRPPVDAGVFASYTVAMRFTVEVGGGDDLWSIAAVIGRQIAAATDGDDKFSAATWSPLMMRTVLGQRRHRMGATAVSHVGPMTLAAAGGDDEKLRVRGVHTFVSNFPLGPEYTAQTRIFARRLVWDIVYLDGDMAASEAAAIGEEMKALLVAATSRRPPPVERIGG